MEILIFMSGQEAMSSGAGHAGESRRRERLIMAIAAFVGGGAAVTGVLIAAAHPKHGHHHSATFTTVFASIAAIVVAVAVVIAVRRANRQPNMQRLKQWDVAQRRETARAVQKGQHLDPQQAEIARGQLETLRSAFRRMKWIIPLAIVAFGMNAVLGTGGLRGLWIVLVAVELVLGGPLLLLHRARLHRYDRALQHTS